MRRDMIDNMAETKDAIHFIRDITKKFRDIHYSKWQITENSLARLGIVAQMAPHFDVAISIIKNPTKRAEVHYGIFVSIRIRDSREKWNNPTLSDWIIMNSRVKEALDCYDSPIWLFSNEPFDEITRTEEIISEIEKEIKP